MRETTHLEERVAAKRIAASDYNRGDRANYADFANALLGKLSDLA